MQDRKYRWLCRGGTALAALLAVVLASNSAYVDPSEWHGGSQWYAAIRNWFSTKAETPRAPPLIHTPRAVLPDASQDVRHRSVLGTDASASSAPLSLILVASRPGRNMHEGSALIGVSRENPQSYVAGALLSNGAELAEIHSDYVVLEHAGKRARLSLSGHDGDEARKGLTSLLDVGGSQPSPPAVATSQEPLTDYLRPSPVYKGTELQGYQVYPGEHAGAFSQLGLMPGDVITALDGVPLTDTVAALDAFRGLLQGAAMKATVLRQGQAVQIALDGAPIAAERERTSASGLHDDPPGQPPITFNPAVAWNSQLS